ncbi:hypothetical protein [Nocardia jiangxiensis]|uniref:Uncharacterized protein n=1 Tax=Nocardia jiangxiensis TaxID=282685 RepID=A0ABW6SE50_9NOCA|nr:hypothetical protein [Nocardia jiangxiensis]
MILDPGRSPARDSAAAQQRRSAVARLRGGSAGAVSGALAIEAHGWAAGAMPLQSRTLLLLVAACAVVGALVTGLRSLHTTRTGLVTALIGGQLLGHAVMSLDMLDMPHPGSLWSPAMLIAHIAAACAASVVIHGAEAAYRILIAALSRALPLLVHPPAAAPPSPVPIAHRDHVIHRIFAADSCRTRGPPLPA